MKASVSWKECMVFEGRTESGFRVTTAAHPAEGEPAEGLRYRVRGQGLDPGQVERAIRLSQERYCSVAAMLRPAVSLTYTWTIEEEAPELLRKTA